MRRNGNRWGALASLVLLATAACGADHATCDAQAPYVACGCGCCVGATPTPRCLAAGESLCDIIEQDRAQAASPTCATAGCSAGVEYRQCAN